MSLIRVCSTSEIPKNGFNGFAISGVHILIMECNGKYYAVSSICTHKGANLAAGNKVGDCVIECPWHGSEFDVRTGEALSLPAVRPLPTFRVIEKDADLYLEIPDKS